MKMTIMRHGRTAANERHAYAGSTDVPLSPEGEAQARTAGVVADVRRVYVSTLSRARRTAQICFPNAELVEVAGLEELDFGAFEGRSADEMADDAAYRAWVDGRCEGRCPGGECRADLTRRVAAALQAIVREAAARGDGEVVVVGHGGTVMAAMHAFADPQADYFSWQVGNCGGYRFDVELASGEGAGQDSPVAGPIARFANWERFDDLSFMEGAWFPRQDASFFTNRACAHFPCHDGVDPAEFNCLFCYCPLYALGPHCGGDFSYTDKGRKNCAGCSVPHVRSQGARLVAERYAELAEIAGR